MRTYKRINQDSIFQMIFRSLHQRGKERRKWRHEEERDRKRAEAYLLAHDPEAYQRLVN